MLVNAQLLAEGWNSPRATICMHLAPTASKRIYQQRVGRVTRRHPGKEAGIVVDFVHPATKHDDPVVTLHSLLDRDVYRGGAIVVGPVRRGRGRRVRVERRVLPVTPDPERRAEVFERELWRIAVEHLDYGEQHVWAALAGARVAPNGWRRAKAMLHFDRDGELKRRFLLTAVQRNRNAQLRLRALQEIAASRDAEAFDTAIDMMGGWPRDERREGVKIMLQALAERRIGRRDQANAWIWRMAEYTREVHEEYAVQRWPETKRLLGLLVNSSGSAHARNARRLVHASRKEDRRLSRGAARRGARPHARGRGGAARRAHADGAQAGGAGPRAAAQLPQGPARLEAPPAQVRRRPPATKARRPSRPRRATTRGRARGRARTTPRTAIRAETEADDSAPDDNVKDLDVDVDDEDAYVRRTTPRRQRSHVRPLQGVLNREMDLAGVERRRARRRRRAPIAGPDRRCRRRGRRPPAHRTVWPASASRARNAASTSRDGAVSQRSSAPSRRASVGSIALGSRPSVAARSRSSGGKSDSRTATLRPIPTTAQRSCGRPSTRIPATLRPCSSTSLGHFNSASGADRLGDRDPDRERQQPRRLADHQRAQQRPPRGRRPGAPLASAAGGLLGGRHERPVRGAARRQLARAGRWSSRCGAGEAAASRSASRRDAQLVVERESERARRR